MNILLFVALLQAEANGSIQGNVVNGANEGIFAARVEITGGLEGPIVTRTDAQGRFAVANLAPGIYRATVKKEEYVRQEYGQKGIAGPGLPIVIESGTHVQGLVFRMQAASTLAGSVRNTENIPIANILVQAMRRTYGVRGNRTITVFSNALTDDLGGYRLYWVDPGNYHVNASYLPQLPTPVNAQEGVPRRVYAPTYYPGFADSVDAREIHLGSGSLFGGIDFRLEEQPASNVQGTVRSVVTKTAVPATVSLFVADEAASTARYIVLTDEKGAFEMRGVGAGTYVLSAMGASSEVGFSTITVKVTENTPRAPDGTPLHRSGDVTIGPGVTVNVRLFGDVPAAADMRSTKVSLLPLESYIPTPQASVVQTNGAMVISGVQPGEYLLSVSGLPDTAYIKAARTEARDVLERFFQVQYESRAPLDIQLGFDGGQITGSIVDSAGKGADRATVVLIPDKDRRHRPDLYRVVTSLTDGNFSIGGIPPGAYKLFPWDTIEPNAWMNAEFMLNYEEFGTPVLVGPSEKVTAQLRMIP